MSRAPERLAKPRPPMATLPPAGVAAWPRRVVRLEERLFRYRLEREHRIRGYRFRSGAPGGVCVWRVIDTGEEEPLVGANLAMILGMVAAGDLEEVHDEQ